MADVDSVIPGPEEKDYVISAAEKSVVRKLDFLYVLPFVFFTSFLQFIDKAALGSSAVLGIREDTHITNDQFGFVGSIFFLGYLIAQAFGILFMQKFSIKRYLGFIIIMWGATLICTAFTKSFAQPAALRFILGVFEGGANPCCIMVISRMYRRNEQARRINFNLLGNGLANIVGSFISYGVGYMSNDGGLHSWQWLMVILGSVTIAFGFFCFCFMVVDPKASVLRLTPEQERVVDLRMLDNDVQISREIKFTHIKECLREPRYYCYTIAGIITNIPNGAFFTFISILISSFGFSNLNSIIMATPCGVFSILYSICCFYYVGKYGNLHYAMCITFSISAIGILLVMTIPFDKAKLLGIYLTVAFSSGYMLIFSSITNNVTGYTKKLFYISTITAAFNLGSYIGPLLMLDSQKPLYIGPMVTFIVCDIIGIILLLISRHIMSKSNKKRFDSPQATVPEEEDLTDRENPNFIYKILKSGDNSLVLKALKR
ncbi:MFS general substrate transporter [Backusella circina FSU 941]|nr:MFS general substrate transporter [Backusella circina FSU 941]